MNQQVTLSEAWEHFLSYDPVVWIGVLSAIIVFAVEIRLCQKGILFASAEKKLKKARELGNIIEATCVRREYIDNKDSGKKPNRRYVAFYKYQVNGEVRKKRVSSTGVKPPQNLSLYYIKSPNKVFSEYDIGASPLQVFLYIIPVLVAFVVMKLLGYEV